MKVAADIMTSKVVTIDSLATILQATKVMKQHNVKTSELSERFSRHQPSVCGIREHFAL